MFESLFGGRVHISRSRIFMLLLIAFVLISAVPAQASPLTDKRAEAEQARDAMAEFDIRLEIAIEAYNEAYAAHAELNVRIAENEARLCELGDRIGTLETHVSSRADAMYRSGPLGMLEVLLGTHSFAEFASLWDTLMGLSAVDSAQIAALRVAREEAKRTEADLADALVDVEATFSAMTARKAEVESQIAERKGILAGVEAEVAQLEAEERAAAQAAATAAAARSSLSSRGDTGGNPSRAPRSEVVAIAKQYLGTPYRWGAVGPDAFDCSGFTMFVYAKVGVLLPHSSRGQYGVGERVSRANLQPGDLVFFGRSRIHHVGIYVGNGQYIHAPRTGDVVRIASLDRSDYVGAVRP